MVRTTSNKQQKRRRARTRKIQKRKEGLRHRSVLPESLIHTLPSSHPPIVESHRFMSSMSFDGKTLTTKTQKDNEPAVETIYTKKHLAEDIPLGNKMVDLYLDGEMPEELQRHHKGNIDNGVYRNVLISPADLGLLPPIAGRFKKREAPRELQTRRRGRQSRYRVRDREYNDGLRMIVNDDDDDDDDDANRKKHIFDLP